MKLQDILENTFAAPKWGQVPHKQAVLACETAAEFEARFKNAPEWVLNRIEDCLTYLGFIHPKSGGQAEYPPSWVRQLREKKAAEKAATEFLIEHPKCKISYNNLVKAFVRGPVKIGDGPTEINWDYEDDHPGDYVDSAWTSSKEVLPGVWYEARHGVGSGTRRWTIVRLD